MFSGDQRLKPERAGSLSGMSRICAQYSSLRVPESPAERWRERNEEERETQMNYNIYSIMSLKRNYFHCTLTDFNYFTQ